MIRRVAIALLALFTFRVALQWEQASLTHYTNPLQLGKLWAFNPLDGLLYAARQLYK